VAQSIGPPVLVEGIRSGAQLMLEEVEVQRHRTLLVGLLGILGLILTLIGIASVTAYAVSRRTREIGVRMAFGADARSVVWTMMRDATWPVGAGLLLGLGTSFYATKLVEGFLFETTPTDPLLRDERIKAARKAQRKHCHGVSLGVRSASCERADAQLNERIVVAVRTGLELPPPDRLP
jgi:hypothetical protein